MYNSAFVLSYKDGSLLGSRNKEGKTWDGLSEMAF